jgi:hypothetical protein
MELHPFGKCAFHIFLERGVFPNQAAERPPMNEPPQDVLLDSNVYFRLAQSVRPLLQQSFGASPNCYGRRVGKYDQERLK